MKLLSSILLASLFAPTAVSAEPMSAPRVGMPPVASFTAVRVPGGGPRDWQFTDTSTGSPTSWEWFFRFDPYNSFPGSYDQNPTHTYLREQLYTVRLRVTNAFGSDETTMNVDARTAGLTICGNAGYIFLNDAVRDARPGDVIRIDNNAPAIESPLPSPPPGCTFESNGARKAIRLFSSNGFQFGPFRWTIRNGVTFRNVDIEIEEDDSQSSNPSHGLRIDASGETVVFEDSDVRARRGSQATSFSQIAELVNITADVVEFRRASVTALPAEHCILRGNTEGADALVVNARTLLLEDVVLQASDAPTDFDPVGDGGAALTAMTSETTLTRCALTDGNGAFVPGYSCTTPLANSTPSLAGRSSFGTLVAASASTIRFGIDGSELSVPGTRATPDPIRVATNRKFGASCRRSIRFAPDGQGGYTVGRTLTDFEANFGADVGITQDDQVSAPQPLGFGFAFPGARPVTSILIDSNGRIAPAGSGLSSSFLPTVGGLLNAGQPIIAPLWVDLNVTESVGGAVRMRTGPGFAAVTWDAIAQYRGNEPITFQVLLRDDDSVTFSYVDTTQFESDLRSSSRNALVGLSPGNGVADPGEVDFSAMVGAAPVVYELWTPSEPFDLQFDVSSSRPIPGGTWDLQLNGVPDGTLAAVIEIGSSSTNVPLDVIGMAGCTLLVNPFIAIPMGTSSVSPNLRSFPISFDTGFTGRTFYAQGATISIGATVLGATRSNAVEMTFGY